MTKMRSGVAWQTLLPLAQDHGRIPLLHRHVSAGMLDATEIHAHATAQLRAQATASAARSLHLAGELSAQLRALAVNDIPVVPLKGPVLAESLYGSVVLRRFKDLDLLFDERIFRAP